MGVLGDGRDIPANRARQWGHPRPGTLADLAGTQQMRESDILLSLMLSPHPSYPPLEMAASGGLVVTTSFGNKSAKALASLSANIIAVPPTLEDIEAGLASAVSAR